MQTSIGIRASARELLQATDLLWAWTARIIRARYQQSTMGWLWAVVQPAASVAILTLVFSLFVRVDTGGTPYVLFSYLAVVPWTFFASAVPDMADSLVQNMTLVGKIYFPREILPISAMLARLLDLGIASGLLVVMIIYFGVPSSPILWLYVPLILAIETAFVLGLGLMAAALNVFNRDVQPLLRLALQVWFYASPIIYPVSMVPAQFQPVYYLNPMAAIIEAYRAVLLYGTPPDAYLALSAVVSVVVLVIGYWLFRRLQFQFADII